MSGQERRESDTGGYRNVENFKNVIYFYCDGLRFTHEDPGWTFVSQVSQSHFHVPRGPVAVTCPP